MKAFGSWLVLSVWVLGSAGEARADVYACKDKEGVVRFADRKLRGMRCVLYAKTPPAPAPVEAQQDDGGGGDGGGGAEARATPGSGMSRAEQRRLSDGASRRNIATSPFSAGPFGRDRTEKAAPIPAVADGGDDTDAMPRAPQGLGNEPESLGERERLYAPFIDEAATLYRLPPELIGAVIRVESNYRYRAVSEKGAMGLMQLMPSVVREMGVGNPWDPRANILGGARLLRVLADRFEGDLVKVLAAYHAGSGAVKGAEGIPYEATESYVRSVLDRYYEYRSRAPRE